LRFDRDRDDGLYDLRLATLDFGSTDPLRAVASRRPHSLRHA
jgi:hypothetical protein